MPRRPHGPCAARLPGQITGARHPLVIDYSRWPIAPLTDKKYFAERGGTSPSQPHSATTTPHRGRNSMLKTLATGATLLASLAATGAPAHAAPAAGPSDDMVINVAAA